MAIFRKIKKHTTELQRDFIKQLLSLTTSGFGLVAALAWNELIKELVTIYVKPIAGKYSGIVSLLIYAVIVTLLAVLVTYNLTKISERD